MKIAGIVILVFGSLSFLGCLIGGNSVFGPLFWIGLGAYLIHRAAQKKKEQAEKDEWNNK